MNGTFLPYVHCTLYSKYNIHPLEISIKEKLFYSSWCFAFCWIMKEVLSDSYVYCIFLTVFGFCLLYMYLACLVCINPSKSGIGEKTPTFVQNEFTLVWVANCMAILFELNKNFKITSFSMRKCRKTVKKPGRCSSIFRPCPSFSTVL